jgi:FkbM family methyltransferase
MSPANEVSPSFNCGILDGDGRHASRGIERTMHENSCVYTCLIGRYEKLNEQPVAVRSVIPFICLTDDHDLTSDTWRIVHVDPMFKLDQVRSQRILKLLPHCCLPDFDHSLYIDNSVILSARPEEIFARYFASTVFALPMHSFRERVIDEFSAVAGLDDEVRISEQLANYEATYPDILLQQPYWTAILMRSHRSELVCNAMGEWAAHVLRYSRRDQLSANFAFWQAGISPLRFDIDNFVSWFHSWPATADRDHTVRTYRSAHANSPKPMALGTAIRHALAAQMRRLDAMIPSRHWPMTKPQASCASGTLENRSGLGDSTNKEPLGEDHVPTPEFIICETGRRIYVDPLDERGKALIKSAGNLNAPSLKIWQTLISEGEWTHIVDVGANYGEMLMNVSLAGDAVVTAIAPNPYVMNYLLRTIAQSGVDIEVVAAAASDHAGTIALNVDRSWSGRSSVVAGQVPSEGHVVEQQWVGATTLTQLIRNRAMSVMRVLVKIDVERHEVAVLRGLLDLLPELDDFAAMVELLHLDDRDLSWIMARFSLELLNQRDNRLVSVNPDAPQALRGLLTGEHSYAQDAVLRR